MKTKIKILFTASIFIATFYQYINLQANSDKLFEQSLLNMQCNKLKKQIAETNKKYEIKFCKKQPLDESICYAIICNMCSEFCAIDADINIKNLSEKNENLDNENGNKNILNDINNDANFENNFKNLNTNFEKLNTNNVINVSNISYNNFEILDESNAKKSLNNLLNNTSNSIYQIKFCAKFERENNAFNFINALQNYFQKLIIFNKLITRKSKEKYAEIMIEFQIFPLPYVGLKKSQNNSNTHNTKNNINKKNNTQFYKKCIMFDAVKKIDTQNDFKFFRLPKQNITAIIGNKFLLNNTWHNIDENNITFLKKNFKTLYFQF